MILLVRAIVRAASLLLCAANRMSSTYTGIRYSVLGIVYSVLVIRYKV
jgi:hypothetical protein